MRPFPTIIIFAALVLVGLAFIPGLGVQLHPSATLPSLKISFSWGEAPAVSVEREVTSKLEGALATLHDVKEISSISKRGRGEIEIEFKKNADLEMARFEISSRIRRLYPDFPHGVSYPSVSVSRAVGRNTPLLMYTVVAPESAHDITGYLESSVLPGLTQLRGVDKVNWYGASPWEFRLVYDTHKMELLGLSPDHILTALNDYFSDSYLGMATIPTAEGNGKASIPLVLQGKAGQNPSWDKIPLAAPNGHIVYLTDVCKVQYTEREAQSYYRINGKSTLMLVVNAQSGVNQVRLANAVQERMTHMERQMPPGWQVMVTWDDTDFIRKDLRRVGYRMVFSFLILMLFVLLVSRSAKHLLLIFLTVITNLAVAVTAYHAFNIQIHLYSLAGITVSFGIIIDNSIVMIEHIRQHHNRKVFLAILAATLTTLGSLSVIFMLSSQQQAQLSDFAAVVLVNLALSLLVAWFLIPALMNKLKMDRHRTKRVFTRMNRRKVKVAKGYFRIILFVRRFRWAMLVILVLGFGLPVHLLPGKLEGEGKGAALYNATLGSRFYQQRMKNHTEKIMGGAFRLFSRFVYERSYFSDPERTTLYVRGQMPDGATVHQLNEAVLQMEHFLLEFPQIEQFQSRVTAPDNSQIVIVFHPEYDRGSFPHNLQGQIIRKAISVGGAEWNVWGVGQGFSNVLRTGGGGSSIILEGYNYDLLYRYAEQLMTMAGENPRMANLRITGAEPWRNINRMEFFLDMDYQQMALQGVTQAQVFEGLNEKLMYSHGPVINHNHEPVPIILQADNYRQYTVWDMENLPLHMQGRDYKTTGWMALDKRAMGNDIYKFNQQYRLHVSYSFMGPYQLEQRVRDQLVDQMNDILPMGYRARTQTWSWQQDESKHYLLIFLVLIIIFFICSILLESLLQPLAILGLIPISFIGLFLTFYLFELNFDQGGWAAFILLSGLAVNAGLYILNDFNNFCNTHQKRDFRQLYLKAFQYKITPVFLTISSTIIGLIPFVIGQREAFWFSFAAGTMGGLAFSILGIFLFFPIFIKMKRIRNSR